MLIYACVSCTFECVCDLQKQKMFPTFCSGLKKAKRQPVHEHRRVAGRLPVSETLPESIHCHRRAPAFFYVYIISNKLPEESKKKKRQQIDPTNRHCVCRQSPVQRMLPCLGGISLLSKNLFSRGQIPSSQLTRPAKESETTRENCVAVKKCVAQLQL